MNKIWYTYLAGFVVGFTTNYVLIAIYQSLNKSKKNIEYVEDTPYCIYCNK